MINLPGSEEPKNIYGYIHPLGNGPSFLIPVFKGDNKLWVQEVKQERIEDFNILANTLTLENINIIPIGQEINMSIECKRGMPAIFAFYLDENIKYCGDKEKLIPQLKQVLSHFSNKPFVKLEVLNFIGDTSSISETIEQAASQLATYNPKQAERWKTRYIKNLKNKIKKEIEVQEVGLDTLKEVNKRAGLNKKELIQVISKKSRQSLKEVEVFLNAMLEVIKESLKQGERITLVGFGTFRVQEKAAREGRNPRTGRPLQIPAKKVPVFSAGKGLKDAVTYGKIRKSHEPIPL